ncbi:MAG: ABC transporter ATP-binding protein/permease, partial [Gemmatimonadaceae bacterium]|nr:ABC transporter ATP-binding protein/permease [Gemmatimonadaceae bacterium]
MAESSKPRSSSLRTLATLLPFVRPYRARMAWGLALVSAGSVAAAGIPWLLRRAIDDLATGAPSTRIRTLAGAMFALALLAGALRYGMREVLNGLSRYVEYDLRAAMFHRLTTLDAPYLTRQRTGDLMARMTNDLGAVRMVAGPAIMYLVNTITGGIVALVFMLRIDARLTGIALLPMVLLPVVMAWLGARIHRRFEAVQDHFGTLTTHAQENLAGARIVRAFRQERAEEAHFAALNAEYRRRNMGLVRLQGAMSPGLQLLAGLGAVAVLGVGGTLALRGTISVGDFVAFGLYLGMLTWPLIALGWVINLFQRGAASMGRINTVLQAAPTITSPPLPVTLPPYPPRQDDDATRWVLRDVSFTVPANTTVGIVGATGSGKSALLDLVPRIFDPQEGEVLLDGIPVQHLALADLRAAVGYVPQESLLFSEPLLANLTYGGASEAQAMRASALAQLDEAIRTLPAGVATMLGERGINLSGGQKQRAAIARALAREPSVVLLDDALSAVDTGTEAAILAGLRDALDGRTAIIASHRVSAVRDAHRIVVLDDGRVVEEGTHDELVARRGRYWQLLRRQQLAEEVDATDVDDP